MLTGIKLIECFRTFQGEGPDAGRAMLLVRFKHCDHKCHFCDTQVKMRISEECLYSLAALQNALDEYRCGLLITGGEPTFKPHYEDTKDMLTKLNYRVANVETNGSQLFWLLKERDWTQTPVKFIYSPKIFDETSCYNAKTKTIEVIDHPNVYIKIPYMNNPAVNEYCKFLSDEIRGRVVEQGEYDDKVWLMPIGADLMDQEEASADVMEACEKYKFNFSGRLHIMYNFI